MIGVDLTPEMVAKARANAERLGYTNVDFLLGDIEALPLEDEAVDVVISNCVLNLVPDKARAFAEMHRVTRRGRPLLRLGRRRLRAAAAGDPALGRALRGLRGGRAGGGRLPGEARRGGVHGRPRRPAAGPIDLPDEALLGYVSAEELAAFRRSGVALTSVTVYGERG